jgi:hypothetical protein
MEGFKTGDGELRPPEHCLDCPELPECKEKVKEAMSRLKDSEVKDSKVVVECGQHGQGTDDVLSRILGGGEKSFSGLAKMIASTGKVGKQFVPQLIHLNPSEIVTLLTLVGVEMARQTNSEDAATAMREIAKTLESRLTSEMLDPLRSPKKKPPQEPPPPPPPATTNN